MAVSVHTSGVFPGTMLDGAGTGIHIPLSSIQFGGGSISAFNATGDYRELLRGINQTYYNFMTGTATGTGNASDFNKPSYFAQSRSNPSVVTATQLKRSYTSSFWYELSDPLNLDMPDES